MIGKVERVDLPQPGLLCLTLRGRDTRGALVLSTLPGALGAGIAERRPLGRHATEAVSQLRRHLAGATIVRVEQGPRAIRVALTRSGAHRWLVCAATKPDGGWSLVEEDGRNVVRSGGIPLGLQDLGDRLVQVDAESLRSCANKVLQGHHAGRMRQLNRILQRHHKRLARKRAAIERDLERAAQADELHEQASLILAFAQEIPPNATSFDATTWSEPPRTIRIELDPRKTPPEQAQLLFRKSKRLKRGLDVAPKRLEEVDSELSALADLRDSFEAMSPDEVTERLEELGASTKTPLEKARRAQREGGRLPYREFVAQDSSAILVGRSAADNDRLTLRVAKPHDLWLHARGVTGAHVVVPLPKGKSCAANALVDAATLAAHFSDLRGEPIVDVLYTPRRYVHKRKGAPVGSVTLGREKVMAVRVDASRLTRLLAHEKRR